MNEKIKPEVMGGVSSEGKVLPEEIMESIATAIGVQINSTDSVLRDYIPNSLTFLQVLLALEDEYAITIDYASLDSEVTVAGLAAVIDDVRRCGECGVITDDSSIVEDNNHSIDLDDSGKSDLYWKELYPSGVVPLNSIQAAYVLGADEGIELGGQATYIYMESRHNYPLSQVEAAVRAVFERHDVLFYRLDIDSGVLRATDSCQAIVEIVELGSDPVAVMDDVRRDIRAAAQSSNEHGPMVSARLFGDRNECRMFIYFNMIVMDAGSVYLFFEELESLLAGKTLAPAFGYRDAASKIAVRRRDAIRRKDLDYWEKKVAELPRRPEFPALVMGEEDWSTRRLSTVLDATLTMKLNERAHRIGVTLSSLVMSVNAAVVCRWLSESALTINVTVSERSGLDSGAKVMGDFTSSMLVGVDSRHVTNIDRLAKAIDQDIREGLSHRSVSGVEVLQRFLRDGDNQTQATAPVVFTSYLGGDRGNKHNPVIEHVYTQTAQVCLDIQVMPSGKGMTLSWDIVEAYFPMVDEMFTIVVESLSAAADGREILPIRHTDTEEAVVQYNDVAGPIHDDTLLSFIESAYTMTPNVPAVRLISLGISYTYAELWERAGKIAHYLLRSGVGCGDAVMVRYTKHPDDIVNMVGVLRAGAAFVPVDANMPIQRQEHVIKAAGVVGTILDTEMIDELIRSDGERTYKKEIRENRDGGGRRRVFAVPATDPDDLAYVIFTSGTTGQPKGVRISHRNCVNTILDVNRRYGINADDRIIGLSSLGFDLSVYDIFGAFAAGATVTMVGDERDADEIIDVLREEQVTLWNSAPALLELVMIRVAEDDVFPAVRTVMLSGDRIAAGLPARAKNLFPYASINSLGGATEGSIWSIHYPLQHDSLQDRIPYGYPLTNQSIHVLSPDGVHCPIGVPGEIYIGGLGVAQGYAADPERTAASFIDVHGIGRCYRTGDIGVFNDEGFVEFLGRSDRQVKIAGFRVELGEIESVLERSGLVSASIATVAESGDRRVLVCLYVPLEQDSCTRDDVRAELARCLPDYMIPKVLFPVAQLPVTVNGKLDQEEIRRYVDDVATVNATTSVINDGTGIAWEYETESLVSPKAIKLVSEIFDNILGEDSSREIEYDSFFHRGGDSLQFQMMMRMIQQRTGVRLHFRDVISDPSILHIASLLSGAFDDFKIMQKSDEAFLLRRCSSDDYEENLLQEFGNDQYAPFPLTDMQKAYYVGRNDGFDLGGVAEHYYIEFITEPGIEIERLEDALNALIHRHPMLRAVFTMHATQRILPDVPHYRINVDDYRDAEETTVNEAVQKKRDELSHQVFDLSSWPLFHLSAFALRDGRYRLFFSVDMIIGDGASQRIFISDLDRLYQGMELPPIIGDYRTYVLKMKRREALLARESDSVLVRKIVEEFPPGNILPSCGTVLDSGGARMRRFSHTFTVKETTLLRERASAADGSISALILACYATSLSLWTRGDTVGINVTTYNRDPSIADVDGVIGDFTGVILMPVETPAEHDLWWWTAELRSRLLEHMTVEYSGVSLLGAIARRRGLKAGQAIAPFVYTSLLFGDGSAENNSRRGDMHVLGDVEYAISQTPQVLLDNQVMEIDGCINVAWDFVEQILDPGMVEDIFDHFIRSLENFAEGKTEAALLTIGQVQRLLRVVEGVPSGCVTYGDSGSDIPSDTWVRSRYIPKDTSEIITDEIQGYIRTIEDMIRVDLNGIEVDQNDDLFLLGYDSLRFVNLIQQIQNATGVSLPLAEALAQPTPRGIAELLRQATVTEISQQEETNAGEETVDCSLMLLRSGDPEHPTFLVHGGFGTVDVYRDLALAMPDNRQVWGVAFTEFERTFPRTISISDIASHYSNQVRAVLPEGAEPAIVGWSLGGTIAADMALKLADFNPSLIFLDSLAPGITVDVGDFSAESEKALLSRVCPSIEDFPYGTSLADLWTAFIGADRTEGERGVYLRTLAEVISPTLVEDLGLSGDRVTVAEFNSLRSLVDARTRYRPQGRVREALFVLPDDGEAHNYDQWRSYLVDDLRVAVVTGNHYSFVLGADAARTGAIISSYIEGRRLTREKRRQTLGASSIEIDRSWDLGKEMDND